MSTYQVSPCHGPEGWAVVKSVRMKLDIVYKVVSFFPNSLEGEEAAQRRAKWLAVTLNAGVV